MNLKKQSGLAASLVLLAISVQAQSNTFPSSGNVGIGTTSPSQKLHVLGNMVLQDVVSDSGAAGYLGVKGRGTTSALAVPITNDALVYFGGGGYDGSTLYNHNQAVMYFKAAETWSSTKNGTYITFATTAKGSTSLKERVRIEDGGNVGIGVTDAVEKLHVSGRVVAEYYSDSTSSAVVRGVKARGDATTPLPPNSGDYLFILGAGGYNGTTMYNNERGMIAFRAAENWSGTANGNHITFETTPNGSTTRQRVMTVDQSGMVGIGIDVPTHPLTVNGAIRAKEIIVDTGWADYVFAPDYRLAPLAEVEQHIKEKGRLPDVPSAKEVEGRGVSIGESQALLLRKVEELTLHLISQEKEMAKLRNEVARLSANAGPAQ